MKNIFKFLVVSFVFMTMSSCDVGDQKAPDFGAGSYVAQFPFKDKTGFFLKDAGVIYNYAIPVEIVGGNGLALSTEVNLVYEVDLINSTAIEGTHFTFVSASRNLTIPAGKKFAAVDIKVLSANLDDSNAPILRLKLKSVNSSGANIVTSGNKSNIAVVLQGFCTSNLAGNYRLVTNRLSPAGGPYLSNLEVIDEVAAGEYNTSATGNYAAASYVVAGGAWNLIGAVADGGYTFKEVCGRIKLEPQGLCNGTYSNLVTQTAAQALLSNVNTTTGAITVEYTIAFGSGPRTYKSVYTPIP